MASLSGAATPQSLSPAKRSITAEATISEGPRTPGLMVQRARTVSRALTTPSSLEVEADLTPVVQLYSHIATPKSDEPGRSKNRLDEWFTDGRVDKFFRVSARGSTLTREIRAALATFATSAYIMTVNPNILSTTGMDFEGVAFATACASFVGSLMMGVCANLPLGVFPAMGINAYVAYTAAGFKGTTNPVKNVMFAVFVEGIIFVVVGLLDLRKVLFKLFPTWYMKANVAGLGLFLAFTGLQAGSGVDLARGHPSVLVDMSTLAGEHYARTWIGIVGFLLMALLLMVKVKGAIVIAVALVTCLCWLLEGVGAPQFSYEPICCLGGVTFSEVEGYYPKLGGGWMPQPTCTDAYALSGDAEEHGNGVKWVGETATDLGNGSFAILRGDGTSYLHNGSLMYNGNWSGRDSAFAGGCHDVCHSVFGGENPSCRPEAGQVALLSTGCWSAFSHHERASPEVVVDPFGEGCIGGAGRIPQTFRHPTEVVKLPRVEAAGDIVAPYPRWFGCAPWVNNTPSECTSGDVEGGTIWAFDTEGLSWANFGSPLLTLAYVHLLGCMAVMYAAADMCGLIDPETPGTFPGAYWAFLSNGVATLVGAVLGTSPLLNYAESFAGIQEGGRTGLTAVIVALLNLACFFFSPLFGGIPSLATGPTLVMIGIFMMGGVRDIEWGDFMQAVPCFVSILLQVTTYHLEYGIIGGLLSYVFLMIFSLRFLLWIPPLWHAMPRQLKLFVAKQDGDAGFRERLQVLGFDPQKLDEEDVSPSSASPVGSNP